MSTLGRTGLRSLLTLGACLLALACGAPSAPTAHAPAIGPAYRPNLLRNPGFLADASAWEFQTDAPAGLVTAAHDQAGFVSLAIHGAAGSQKAGWTQTVAVQPAACYRAGYRMQTERLAGWAGMRLSFYDAEGRLLWETGGVPASGDSGWTSYAWRCRAPAGATQATAWVGVEAASGGRAAFDDCHLGADDAPVARALIVDYRHEAGRIRTFREVNCAPGEALGGALLDLEAAGVRVVVDVAAIFPDARADPDDAQSYRFAATDAALEALAKGSREILLCLSEGQGDGSPRGRPQLGPRLWAEVARHIAMHYNEGWAGGYRHGIRHWEVGDGPDASEGPPEVYYALLEATIEAFQAYDPGLRVGGPALASAAHLAFLEGLLARLASRGLEPGFISWRSDYAGAAIAGATTQRQIERLLERYGFTDAEVIVSVWEPADGAPDQDSGYRAAHWVASLAYWHATRLSRAYRSWPGEDAPAPELLPLLRRFEDAPRRLAAQGGDDLGFALLAGKSDDGQQVRIAIADTGSRSEEYRLALAGFPPGYHYVVREVSQPCRAEVVAEGDEAQLLDGVLRMPWRSPAAHFIEVWWGGAGGVGSRRRRALLRASVEARALPGR